MMSERPVKRPPTAHAGGRNHHASKRESSALETRRRIRAAAQELFLRDGYVRTTTKAIAVRAGVVEKTVFLAFPNKAALLSEIIRVCVRGDDEQAPMAIRASWQEMLSAPASEILARFAQLNGEILARTARILALAEAAAAGDVELAARRDASHAHLRRDIREVAHTLSRGGVLDAGITPARAADTIYALVNETIYLLLIDECGWTQAHYVDWLADTLRASLTDARTLKQPRP